MPHSILRKEVHDRRPRFWFAAARNLTALALWRGRFWTSRARLDRSAGCSRPKLVAVIAAWTDRLRQLTISTLVLARRQRAPGQSRLADGGWSSSVQRLPEPIVPGNRSRLQRRYSF